MKKPQLRKRSLLYKSRFRWRTPPSSVLSFFLSFLASTDMLLYTQLLFALTINQHFNLNYYAYCILMFITLLIFSYHRFKDVKAEDYQVDRGPSSYTFCVQAVKSNVGVRTHSGDRNGCLCRSNNALG